MHGIPLVTNDLLVIGTDDRRPDGTGYIYAFRRSTMAHTDGLIRRLDLKTGVVERELRIGGTPMFRLMPAGKALLVFVNEEGIATLKSLPLTLDGVHWTATAPEPGWTSFSLPTFGRTG